MLRVKGVIADAVLEIARLLQLQQRRRRRKRRRKKKIGEAFLSIRMFNFFNHLINADFVIYLGNHMGLDEINTSKRET